MSKVKYPSLTIRLPAETQQKIEELRQLYETKPSQGDIVRLAIDLLHDTKIKPARRAKKAG